MLGSCRGHARVILGSCWGHAGGHAGVLLGSCWGHAGVMLGSCQHQFSSVDAVICSLRHCLHLSVMVLTVFPNFQCHTVSIFRNRVKKPVVLPSAEGAHRQVEMSTETQQKLSSGDVATADDEICQACVNMDCSSTQVITIHNTRSCVLCRTHMTQHCEACPTPGTLTCLAAARAADLLT